MLTSRELDRLADALGLARRRAAAGEAEPIPEPAQPIRVSDHGRSPANGDRRL